MEKYNYLKAVEDDVREYVYMNSNPDDFDDYEELKRWLDDRLKDDDFVTGDGSGSYTHSTWQAEENLCHNWDLLREAVNGAYDGTALLEKGPEECDVIIRCYLLRTAVEKVLPEIWNDMKR